MATSSDIGDYAYRFNKQYFILNN